MRRCTFFSGQGICVCVVLLCCFASCSRSKPAAPEGPDLSEAIATLSGARTGTNDENKIELLDVLLSAEIPEELAHTITMTAADDPAFILELLICLEEEPWLYRLVDKNHPLPPGYEPDDLVELGAARDSRSFSYQVNRAGLMLRKAAADSLQEMAAAARDDGVTLIASSAYRSYNYQEQVYGRIVREMGQEAADRESARPGYSQHQTGLTLDFGSIDDSFAGTAAGRWMSANASRFGWSLSFPDGYEHITGYRWESWHYRYVGRDIAAFINNYFNGIQQYALRFIFEWENSTP